MHTLRIHILEAKYEFLKLLRQPAYALPTIAFPLVFYIFFGVLFGSRQAGNINVATYMVATYGAFGVIGAALFGFGVGVAVERSHGWLELKQTTPMPISAYFIAKIVMAMLFGAIIVVALFAIGTLFAHVTLTPMQAIELFAVLVSGSIVFCSIGLAIGVFVSPNAAPPIVNLLFLPMSFLSGLWMPIQGLPKAIQSLAHWLPPYHYSQLALRTIGSGNGESSLVHIAALAAFTALFTSIAYVGFRRGGTS